MLFPRLSPFVTDLFGHAVKTLTGNFYLYSRSTFTMKTTQSLFGRRAFIKATALATTGVSALALTGFNSDPSLKEESLLVIGPKEGYSPHIGTLVSMLNYNRHTIINQVKFMTQPELDYLHDEKANTIGALLMHLGATEKFYQINTFEGRQEYNEAEKKIWGAAMSLGDEGRAQIKGKEIGYYLDLIKEVRTTTLEELKKKDAQGLLAVDPAWSREQSVNTYWKWFHVCEHESNHRGQISWLKSRLPGAKPGRD
jgi:uncharacterized damage-inducible protein DinB